MRKKILLRGAALLLFAAAGAALINPYSRQWLFGPTYAGVPLCAWQNHLRRQVVGEGKDTFVAGVFKWFQPKNATLPFDKLSRDDKIAIWLTLLDDPVTAMRVQSIQTLWGGGGRFNHWGGSWISTSGTSGVWAESFLVVDASAPTMPAKYATIFTSLDIRSFDGPGNAIHPPCDVTPHLIRMLDDPEVDVRGAAFDALTGLREKAEPAFGRLFELLADSDPLRRRRAATTLNQTHPKTRAWLGRLIAMLDDGEVEVRKDVAICLQAWHDRRMAVAAGPALLKMLRDTDPLARLRASAALASLQVHRPQAAETARAALRHPDIAVRSYAIGFAFELPGSNALFLELVRLIRSEPNPGIQRAAVGELRSAGKQAVPLLISLMQHATKEMRQMAITTLASLGADARAAVPNLIAGLEDEFAVERIQALGSIGDPDAIPKLIELLDDVKLCPVALSALAAFGVQAKPAVPKLLKLMQFGSHEICQQAAHCLGEIGRQDEAIVPQLLPLLRDGTSNVYHQVVQLLVQIAPDHEQTLPALARLAFDGPENGRGNQFSSLIHLGPKARPLLPQLLRRLNESNDSMRTNCIQLLGAIGPDAAGAVPLLLKWADPLDNSHGAYAIEALGKIASDKEKVVPLLIRLTRSENTVETALEALGNFGPGAAESLPEVLRLLKSDKATTRNAAAAALCKLMSRADDAVPHLLPLLRDADDSVRTRTMNLLGNFGPAARAAIPALSDLLDDDSQTIGDTALTVLARIEP